jgi:hypothetical protein
MRTRFQKVEWLSTGELSGGMIDDEALIGGALGLRGNLDFSPAGRFPGYIVSR